MRAPVLLSEAALLLPDLLGILPPARVSSVVNGRGLGGYVGIGQAVRTLQGLPDYTSPPTELAISATPSPWRSDESVDAMRAMARDGNCTAGGGLTREGSCQILFDPPVSDAAAKLGVLFYGGALVDPRAFSPLARVLSSRYGLAVSVPVFDRDLAFAFGSCDTGRLALAMEAFPDVERWVLAGHSFGGIALQTDLWTMMGNNDTEMLERVGGIAFLGSYVRQDLGCGATDFSSVAIPAASVSGELDYVVNRTNWEAGREFLPRNDTFWLEVKGGNHAQFGSYDDSERKALLGQNDGVATVPEVIQRDLSAAAIAHVASRVGQLTLPNGSQWWADTDISMEPETEFPPPAGPPSPTGGNQSANNADKPPETEVPPGDGSDGNEGLPSPTQQLGEEPAGEPAEEPAEAPSSSWTRSALDWGLVANAVVAGSVLCLSL